MELSKKYPRIQPVDIRRYYSVNIKEIWKGLKQEPISFWLLCIYFFFEYVRPQSLYPVLDIAPWPQIFLILTLVTAILDKSVHWVSHIQNKLFVTFSIVITLSGYFAFDPWASWDYRNVMLTWFIVYFLVITIVNTERRLILFFLAYFLFNLKMAQHGVVSWVSRDFSFAGHGLIGSPGYFRNSGEYAIQMIIYGSLAIAFVAALKRYWSRYKKWFFYIAAATGYMAVIGASSRGAQLGLAAIGIWVVLKQRGGFKGLLFLIIASIVIYNILPDEQIQRFQEMGQDRTSLQRLTYWKIALEDVIPENILLGVGYHNWITYVEHLYPQGVGVMNRVQESHNIYIQAASELGITGLLIFLFMIILAFITNARTRVLVKDLDNKLIFYLTYGLDAGLIGYLVAGTFVTVLYYPFFWVQIAMIVSLYSVSRSLNLADKSRDIMIHPEKNN